MAVAVTSVHLFLHQPAIAQANPWSLVEILRFVRFFTKNGLSNKKSSRSKGFVAKLDRSAQYPHIREDCYEDTYRQGVSHRQGGARQP